MAITAYFIHIFLCCVIFTCPFHRETELIVRMKEESLYHRRLSLCPNATSPPKIDPRTLTRNLSCGGDSDLYNFSSGKKPHTKDLSSCSLATLAWSCLYSLSADWLPWFMCLCVWLCVVGSHQAVKQTGTISP